MRTSRNAIDTDELPWEQVSAHLQRKLLNGTPEEGPHTMLLRSEPRAPGGSSGQYHPVNEEFFCLDGDFTFDGSTWFREGSYVHYPAFFVHGTGVNVRGGYTVYLRLSGASELFIVDEPLSNVPYYVGEGDSSDCALQLVDAFAEGGGSSGTQEPSLQIRALYRDSVTGGGSSLVTISSAAVDRVIEIESGGLLELLTLSGKYTHTQGEPMKARSYHCEVDDHPRLALRCHEPGTLLISHDAELRLKNIDAIHSTGEYN